MYEAQARQSAQMAASFGSDEKLKKEIKPLAPVLPDLMKLTPTNYYFRTNEFPTLNLPETNQYGLIAQELESVFPHLVTDVINAGVEHKAVNYLGLNVLLLQGLKEQNAEIAILKNEIRELKGKFLTEAKA